MTVPLGEHRTCAGNIKTLNSWHFPISFTSSSDTFCMLAVLTFLKLITLVLLWKSSGKQYSRFNVLVNVCEWVILTNSLSFKEGGIHIMSSLGYFSMLVATSSTQLEINVIMLLRFSLCEFNYPWIKDRQQAFRPDLLFDMFGGIGGD